MYRYRAKRLRFLINGDKFYSGINYALNLEKVRSYDALLNELTQTLMDHIKLCKGVRYIFNLNGGLVASLADFEDGNTYVCSSIDTFTPIEYRTQTGTLNWLVRNAASISSANNVRLRKVGHQDYQRQSKSASATPNPKVAVDPSRQLLTPTIKATSHNSNTPNQSRNSNHQAADRQRNQTESPASNGQVGHPTSVRKTSHSNNSNSKKVVDTSLSQKQSNTPPVKTTTVNNSNNNKNVSQRKRVMGNSPQPNSPLGKNNNRSMFGYEVTEKYDIGRPIGDGHFSVVYCCMDKTTQQFCALKLIDKLKCRGRDDMIYNEVKILKQLNHPNIVKLIEEFDYSKQLYLILELVQDGDLFDAISTVTKFSEVHVATMIYNLSSALTYLHSQGIVHRDIKPENLLISVQEDGSQSVKLADFGLAVEVGDNPLFSVCGTAFYVSPEMLNETGYDYKVDVWSTGVICFILLCGYPPFTSENESNQDELFDAILAGDFQFAPPYWSKISQHAKNLIKCMLTVDPEQRYTAEQVFKNPWTMGVSSNFEGTSPMNMSRKIASQSQ